MRIWNMGREKREGRNEGRVEVDVETSGYKRQGKVERGAPTISHLKSLSSSSDFRHKPDKRWTAQIHCSSRILRPLPTV